MSSELAVIAPRTLSDAKEMAVTLAKATMVPTAFRNNPADVMAVVMAGAELGLAPMASLRGIVMIDGKPTLSADAMAAIVLGRGDICEYLRCVKTTADVATYETKRKGSTEPTSLSFTMADARTAGLDGKKNWKTFPAAMLRARALSALCRMAYPDILMGVYDTDEGEDIEPTKSVPTVFAPKPDAVDAEFRNDDESLKAIAAFKRALEECTEVTQMEAVWRAQRRSDLEAEQKQIYIERRRELTSTRNTEKLEVAT